jgi:hypothetical protein
VVCAVVGDPANRATFAECHRLENFSAAMQSFSARRADGVRPTHPSNPNIIDLSCWMFSVWCWPIPRSQILSSSLIGVGTFAFPVLTVADKIAGQQDC